jgi:hypothetical protein
MQGIKFVFDLQQVIGFCALITGIWGVWKIVKEIKKPSNDLHDLVERHDYLLKKGNQRLEKLESASLQIVSETESHDDDIKEIIKSLKDAEETNKIVLKSLFVIINHDITNNGIDKLKETLNELNSYLVEK